MTPVYFLFLIYRGDRDFPDRQNFSNHNNGPHPSLARLSASQANDRYEGATRTFSDHCSFISFGNFPRVDEPHDRLKWAQQETFGPTWICAQRDTFGGCLRWNIRHFRGLELMSLSQPKISQLSRGAHRSGATALKSKRDRQIGCRGSHPPKRDSAS